MGDTKLKKNHLSYIETIAMSVAIMAPTAAMALNVSLMASVSGYSISLVFLIAIIVIGFVALSFIKFNQYFSTAGSVYTFTTKSLGKKLGFLSGWLLFLTYLMFTAASSAEVGSFLESFFSFAGFKIPWLPISIVCTIIVWIFSFMDVKISTRIMLVFEGISIALILILSAVVLFKVGTTTGLSTLPFQLNNNNFSSLAQAVVFGFMSFAGFEGASSLGEETKNPKKYIPLAIICAVGLTGIFYLLVSYVQVMGFGLTSGGIGNLAASASPLGDLASKYMSNIFSLLIMFGAGLSAFSCALGSAAAGARILYSMSNDGIIPKKLSIVHPKFNSPHVAINIIMVCCLVFTIGLFQYSGSQVFGYLGTIAVLALLLAYLATNIGAIIYFTKSKVWKGFHLVIPTVAVFALGFTFYSNIYPIPTSPFNLFPYIVLGWILLGLIITFTKRFKENNISIGKELNDVPEEV